MKQLPIATAITNFHTLCLAGQPVVAETNATTASPSTVVHITTDDNHTLESQQFVTPVAATTSCEEQILQLRSIIDAQQITINQLQGKLNFALSFLDTDELSDKTAP